MKTSLLLAGLFLIPQSGLTQSYMFKDDFNDNGRNWPLSSDDSGVSSISGGKLFLSHTKESGTNWVTTGVYFDPDENFEIETSIRYVLGDNNSTNGLLFGISNSSNFYSFDITNTQYFRYQKITEGTYETIIPWTHLPDVIYKDGRFNKLEVKKKDGNLKFYINDKFVGSKPFAPFYGQKFGFWTQKNSMEVDYFYVRGGETAVIQQQQQVQQQVTVLRSDVDENVPISRTRNDDAIAVVIGNTEYLKTKKVNYAVNDAKSVKTYLVKTFGFKEGNILYVENATKGDFELLFGTKENHRGKLSNTIKQGVSDVFVFYSGHGAPGLKDQKGYFVPVECDPNYVELTGYPAEIFYANLSKIGAKSVTVALDACFSGATIFENISPILIKEKPETISPDILVLSSSTGSEVSSWYNDQSHGMFTYFFLKSIQDHKKLDRNGDRKLTAEEMFFFISDNNDGVPYWARRIHGIEQHPTLSGNQKDRVLIEY